MNENKSPVVGKACKQVTYSVSKFDKMSDMVLVKYTNIHEDGTRSFGLAMQKDWKRDFYIVKPEHRKFKQKKDYIPAKMCDKFRSSQAKLAANISQQLYGRYDKNADLRKLLDSPYVFGCNNSTPVEIKNGFFNKYPHHQTTEPYTLAAYDVETNMHTKLNEIIMASTTMKKKVIFSVDRHWFNGEDDKTILRKLKEAELTKLRPAYKDRDFEVEYRLADNEAEIVKDNVKKWHKWNPDIIGSWNAGYDMERNQIALERHYVNPVDVYNDSSVPEEFRFYNFHPGRKYKKKNDGTQSPLEWQERFPTVTSMAGWKWIDNASFYAIKRVAGGKKDSYGLQFTMKDNGLQGKLYDSECPYEEGSEDWHKWMQIHDKYGYCMYNIGDNFAIEILNEATNDISLSLPQLLKYSEVKSFPSNPTRISETLSFIAKDNKMIWGVSGSKANDAFDKILPGLGDWIALLETEKNADIGYQIFNGLNLVSRARGETDDIDVEGTYPNMTIVLNVGNRTTQIEVCYIEGLNETEFRETGVNFISSPEANAFQLCNRLHGFPKLSELEKYYDEVMIKGQK